MPRTPLGSGPWCSLCGALFNWLTVPVTWTSKSSCDYHDPSYRWAAVVPGTAAVNIAITATWQSAARLRHTQG